ncbi:M56 family metallopeptidase [Amycolatopsis sp. K13G38]|uniref:M56 family metallopeptidase n=1 Tax=Amycolatopsis acididurans TaxID=2724524 RepID=A0ABX1IZD1_9PSEU|nr:M56 family metallopeptidase [Amycolatopsis acididurans]NKQ52878.1 M56 family metallopeptidase [Amycolatopsis acididurans]
MIFAFALLVGAVAAGWTVPRRLWAADLRRHDPAVLIVAWLLSILGVVLAVVTGVVLLLVPSHGDAGALLVAIHHCWRSIQHGSSPASEEFGGVVGVIVLAALTVRLAVVGFRGIRRRARARREHLAALRLAGRFDEGSPATVWLAHERPLAFSLGGRGGVIVATEGLRRHLAGDGVAAVLAHERAHLRGRHHQLLALADALRTAFPVVPLFQQAPAALRELVEIAADVAATRAHGPAAVRAALLCVSGRGAPGRALAMARDAVPLRLARLNRGTRPPGRARRVASCGAAGIAAALVPFAVAGTVVIALAVAACP